MSFDHWWQRCQVPCAPDVGSSRGGTLQKGRRRFLRDSRTDTNSRERCCRLGGKGFVQVSRKNPEKNICCSQPIRTQRSREEVWDPVGTLDFNDRDRISGNSIGKFSKTCDDHGPQSSNHHISPSDVVNKIVMGLLLSRSSNYCRIWKISKCFLDRRG